MDTNKTDTGLEVATVNDVFISYARDDDTRFVEDLYRTLVGTGMNVWWDRVSMPSRALTFHHEIRVALDEAERVLLVLGPAAAASEYVNSEWRYALATGKAVTVVVRLGGFDLLPPELKNLHAVDGRAERSPEDTFAQVIRLLQEPVPPLARLIDVPPLPPHFLPRADITSMLADTVLVDRMRPYEATTAPRSMVLHGMSGSGKSTIAAAFARMIETRRAFPDAVIWIPCEPEFDLTLGARSVFRTLSPGGPRPQSAEETARRLEECLAGTSVLLILDDVRSAEHAAPFLAAIDGGSRVLMTSLDGSLATTVGAAECRVDVFTVEQSNALLEDWVDGAALPPEAKAVIDESGGLPFALSIVGAMARDGHEWSLILALLRRRDLDALERKFPQYPHPHLFRALDAGVEALRQVNPQAAARYLDLAVFRSGTAVPKSLVVRFWSRVDELDAVKAKLLLPLLERRALIRREGTGGERRVRLHGLHEDYLRVVNEDLPGLHADLVNLYSTMAPAGWASGPDDGYYFDHLSFHLKQAGRTADLATLVDRSWIEAQLNRTHSHAASVADLEIALESAAEEPVDVVAFARNALLESLLHAAAMEVPPTAIGALAGVGEVERALDWLSLHTDPDSRFSGLTLVAEELLRAGEVDRARPLLREALITIAALGATVETGFFPGLTQLNAVHALVGFPYPDQWEGTTPELVEQARIPLEATIELIPLLADADMLAATREIRNPFWYPYDSLLPRLAAERLAVIEYDDLARSLLDVLELPDVSGLDGAEDIAHAAAYRDAVAWAALGEHTRAIELIDAVPDQAYRSVGYHRIAVHAATANRLDLALGLVEKIDDPIERAEALAELVPALVAFPDRTHARTLADRLLALDDQTNAIAALTVGGYLDEALAITDDADSETRRAELLLAIGWTALNLGREAFAGQIADRLVGDIRRDVGPDWLGVPYRADDEEWAQIVFELAQLLVATDRWSVCVRALETLSGEALWSAAVDLGTVLATYGRMVDVLALADRFDALQVRAFVLLNAIVHADAASDRTSVRTATEQLLEIHQQLSLAEAGVLPLHRVIPTLVEFEEYELAGACVERIGDAYRRDAAAGDVALAHFRAGNLEAAHTLVARVTPTIRPIPGLTALLSALSTAARTLVDLGERDEARRILEHLEEVVAELEVDASTSDLAVDLAAVLAAAGEVEKATTLATTIGGVESTELARVFFEATMHQARATGTVDATTLEPIAAVADVQAEALAGVAIERARRGERAEAADAASQAANLASLLSMFGMQGSGVGRTAVALAHVGAAEDAIALAEGNLLALTQVALAMAGEPQAALQLIEDVLSERKGSFALWEQEGGPHVFHVDEYWDMLRDRDAARFRVLVSAVEVAAAAGNEQRAVEYADEAAEMIQASLVGSAADRVLQLSVLAQAYYHVGDSVKTQELLWEADELALELRDQATASFDPLLAVARAWAAVGEPANAERAWLTAAERARFDGHLRIFQAITVGLECQALAGRVDDVRNITLVLMQLGETWPLT